jgi:hypothetical protein
MKKLTSIAILLTSASLFTASASAEEPAFEKEFVQRTILGNWQPGAHAVSNETPNVDASLAEFAASIWGKYPLLTQESHTKGTATALLFTQQFE